MKILLFGATGAVGTAVEKICMHRKIKCIGLSHGEVEITKKTTLKKRFRNIVRTLF